MKVLSLGLTYKYTLDVKRAEAVSGVIGDPVVVLSGLRCSYPMAVDPSGIVGLREAEILQTLTEVFWVFVEGIQDIREGDVVSLDGVNYVVRMTQERDTPSVLAAAKYTRLTVEHLTR